MKDRGINENDLNDKGVNPSELMRKQYGYGWNQIVMAANTPVLLQKTMVDGEVDYGIISGG